MTLDPAPPRLSERAGAPLMAASVAVVVWGLGPLCVRAVGASGLAVATYRLWIGVPVMFLILAVTRGRLDRRTITVAAPAGVLFAADIALGFSAFQHTSLANASIIGALSPVLVLLASGPLFGERIRSVDLLWFSVAIAATVAVVVTGQDTGERALLGDALAAASLVTWTIYFLYVKRTRVEGVPAFAFMTAVITWAAVALTPYGLLAASDLDAVRGADFLWITLMAIGPGAVGHGLMTWAHRYVNVNVSSILTLAGPVVTAIGAWILFDEAVSAGQAIGGLVVLVAVALVLAGHADAIPVEPLEGE